VSHVTEPGWYPDPELPNQSRYWDGAAWTEHRADATPAQVSPAQVMPAQVMPAQVMPGFLLTVGDIGVTAADIVTPNGTAALAGSTWIVSDMSVTERRIPTWAIVCAIVFALACLLGLLFLLVKEDVTRGYVQVSVRSGDLSHMTQIPVTTPVQVAQIRAQVAQAQTLAAQAPPASA
jgi:hypothetical protein